MVGRGDVNKILFVIIFIVVVFGFALVISAYPLANDDWWYLSEIENMGWWGSVKYRFEWDNTRICNLIDTFMLTQPLWISKAIFILSIALGLYLMTKVSKIEVTQWRSMSLLCFLFWVGPVWEDAMFSVVYAYNYIVSIPIFIGLIYIYQDPKKFPLWLGVLLGLLLAVWHESFSICFVGGVVLDFVFNRKQIDKERIIILLSVLVGTLWFFLTPAVYYRQSHNFFCWWYGIKLAHCWIYFAYVILWIVYFFKTDKKKALAPLHMFAVASGCLIAFVMVTGFPRAIFPGMILSCCGVTVILQDLLRKVMGEKVKSAIAVLLALFTAASQVTAAHQTVRLAKMAEKIAEIYRDPSITAEYAFAQIEYPWDGCPLALRRPDNELMLPDKRNMRTLSIYFKRLMIVPAELAEYRQGQGEQISDNPAIRLWKGHLVSENLQDTVYTNAFVDFGLREDYSKVESVIFKANDGKEYVYILPIRSIIATYLDEPKRVRMNVEQKK